MIKRFNSFVKESVENKGKGVGGENDLFPSAPKKQTINRAIPTMDFLRIGKHILTKKIDGFIDSVQNESIFITDRITGETKKYTLKEVLKELTQAKEPTKGDSSVKGFEGTPAWATKQKIYEDYELEREYEPEGPDTDVAEEEQELEYGDEEEAQQAEIEYGDEEEADTDNDQEDAVPSNNLRNKILYGTEDNPEGLPNMGDKRDMPNESWIKYWEKFNQKQFKLVTEDLEEEVEQEEEAPIIRGTEDNPLPDRRKTKIESYE